MTHSETRYFRRDASRVRSESRSRPNKYRRVENDSRIVKYLISHGTERGNKRDRARECVTFIKKKKKQFTEANLLTKIYSRCLRFFKKKMIVSFKCNIYSMQIVLS